MNEFSTLDDFNPDDLTEAYGLWINLSYSMDSIDKKLESQKILDFISIIKKDGYLPDYIAIRFTSAKGVLEDEVIKTYWIDDINTATLEQIEVIINTP